jgi:hypothetical protein
VQAARRERLIWIGFVCFTAVCALILALAVGQRLGIAASLIFLLLVLALRPHAQRYLDEHLRWERGARAEEAVGELLDTLQCEGWMVLHDIERYGDGNVDHVVAGPRGVFLIETKDRRYEDAHLGRVKRQAARVHDDLGVWVTPVICLYRRTSAPFTSHGVWVVPKDHLLRWLRQQDQRPADPVRVAKYSEKL